MKNHLSISFTFVLPATFLFLGIVYMILFAGFVDGPFNPAVLTILAVGWFFLGQKGELPLEKPILAFLSILALTSLTSIDPRRSFSEVLAIGTGLFLFFVISEIVKRWISINFVITLILIIGLGLMLLSWSDTLRWYIQWVKSSPGQWIPGISYRLNGSNLMAAFYNLILILAGARFIQAKSPVFRIGWAFYCFSALVLIFLTSSRGAWFGTAAGLIALLVLSQQTIRTTLAEMWKKLRHPRLAIALLSVVILVGQGFTGWIYLRLFALHPTHVALLTSRGYIWNPAWQGFLQSPIWGKGPYTYGSLLMRTLSIPPADIYVHAHNMYLDIMEGSGLLGLFAFGWLVFSIGKKYRSRLSETVGKERALVIGSVAALVSYCVHGIFDGVYLMTFATSTVIIILGASLSSPGSQPTTKRGIPVYLGLCLVALTWTSLWLANPLIKGVQSLEAGNYAGAVQFLKQAVQRDGRLAVTHQQAGLVYSFQAYRGDAGALQPAIQAFEEAIKLDPDWSLNYANLAAVYRQQGSLQLAVKEFQKAVQLSSEVAVYSLNLGQTLEMDQQPAQAQQAYFQALKLRPDWAEAYFFRATHFRKQVLAAWQAENPPQETTTPNQAPLEGSVQGYAIDILKPVETLLDDDKIDEASRLLLRASLAYLRNNEDRLEFQWLQAALEAKKGNLEQAVQLGEKALDGYRNQGVYGPGTYGQNTYASQLFHSYALKDDFVAQMTLIVLTDRWGKRENQLIAWYRELGNTQRSDQLKGELEKNIPDFSPKN